LQEQGVKVVAQLGLPLPNGGVPLRVVVSNDDAFDEPIDEAFEDDLSHDHPAAEGVPELPVAQPQDELTMEMQPSPDYAEPEVEAKDTSPIGSESAAEEQPQGDGADTVPDQAPVEEAAMSGDDLLPPLSDAVPEVAPPPQDLLAAMLRPRAPTPAPIPESPAAEVSDVPDRARLAKALRGLPRHGPGVQRDRLTLLARRIDALLERMSEASGAGRW
jgi:hypothetical protein